MERDFTLYIAGISLFLSIILLLVNAIYTDKLTPSEFSSKKNTITALFYTNIAVILVALIFVPAAYLKYGPSIENLDVALKNKLDQKTDSSVTDKAYDMTKTN